MNIVKMYPPQKDSPSTYLMGDVGPTDTFIFVGSSEIFNTLSVPFPLTLGFDKAVTETVIVTDVGSGGQLTVVRGPSAIAWIAGARCARIWTSDDLIALQHNILEIVNGVDAHKEAEMPHKMTNKITGKIYRYGFGVNDSGGPVFLYEEVENND